MNDTPPPRPAYAPAASAEPQAHSAVPNAAPHAAPLRFTGEGAEYFRIWTVNLLLTLATLGVYSAWAKVRKARYFWQNTRLEGHAFDYHGKPAAILLGRGIALALLVAYSVSFNVSKTAGLVVIGVLFVAGPWLFMRAQRFRFVNSSWRGIRFGFDANIEAAYRAALPPLVIWFSSTILAVLVAEGGQAAVMAGGASGLLVPWMHHRLKAYQHGAASYGDRAFSFAPATAAFYGVYLRAGLLTAAAMFASIMVFTMALSGGRGVEGLIAFLFGVLLIGVFFSAFLLFAWPYFAARLQVVVWSHTRLGPIRFVTTIAARPLMLLVVKNVGLTLFTAGLYWPFAAVALARYRVECMRAESDSPITLLAANVQSPPGAAAGDAAVDMFGLDIGL